MMPWKSTPPTITTLPTRSSPSGKKRFDDLLVEIGQRVLDGEQRGSTDSTIVPRIDATKPSNARFLARPRPQKNNRRARRASNRYTGCYGRRQWRPTRQAGLAKISPRRSSIKPRDGRKASGRRIGNSAAAVGPSRKAGRGASPAAWRSRSTGGTDRTVPAGENRRRSKTRRTCLPIIAVPRLANWLASDRNPLTARVIVNRVWLWHFGQGLVRTPNDFGLRGERPTHPELLDWLAGRFHRARLEHQAFAPRDHAVEHVSNVVDGRRQNT